MKILLTGADGYTGFPLIQRLASRNHQVLGLDNGLRRNWVKSAGSDSAIKIISLADRRKFLSNIYGKNAQLKTIDITKYDSIKEEIKQFQPEAIIHLSAQPSAPFSMKDHTNAAYTLYNNSRQTNNILWAMKRYAPNASLVFTSTMGEYGQPPFIVPEHQINNWPAGRMPGSYYHSSKVLDTHNIILANRNFGLNCTVLMTAVVYGVNGFINADQSNSATRFDFDKMFGTVLNRFIAQTVINNDITIYGKGGQTRAFISLYDFVESVTKIAENSQKGMNFMNQAIDIISVKDLANSIYNIGKEIIGTKSKVRHVKNPRVEKEEHDYKVETDNFDKMYKTKFSIEDHIKDIYEQLDNPYSKNTIRKYQKSI